MVADGKRCNHLSVNCVHYHHHLIAAPDKEAMILIVNCHGAWRFSGRNRPFFFDLHGFHINNSHLVFIFVIIV